MHALCHAHALKRAGQPPGLGCLFGMVLVLVLVLVLGLGLGLGLVLVLVLYTAVQCWDWG